MTEPTLCKLDHRTGRITFGPDNSPMPPAFRWAAFAFWRGHAVTDERGAVLERYLVPMHEPRTYLTVRCVPYDQAGPCEMLALDLASIDEPGCVLRFEAYGWNNRQAVERLLQTAQEHLDAPSGRAGYVVPVVLLGSDSKLTKHGELFWLAFDVVDWTDGARLLSEHPTLSPDAQIPRRHPPVPEFIAVADRMEANGWHPVAEIGTSRKAARKGYLKPRRPGAWSRLMRRSRSLYYTGMLTAHTPAIDIDVTDPDLAVALVRLARRSLGRGLMRVGQAPKAALLYRTDEPFGSLSLAFSLGGKDHLVEVLGNQRKITAVALHHRTRKPYAWPNGSPLDVHTDSLPTLTENAAERFLDAVSALVTDRGGVISSRSSGGAKRDGHVPRAFFAASVADRVDVVADALARIDNSGPGVFYDQWVKIGIALKWELGEEAGEPLFLWWSEQSDKFDLGATLDTWRSLNPNGRITAGTIFHIARHGWNK